MVSLGSVSFDVKANTTQAVSGLRRTEQQVKQVGDSTKRAADQAHRGRQGFSELFSSIKSAGPGLTNVTGLLAGAGGLTVALGAVAGAAAGALKGFRSFALGLTEAQNDLDSNAAIVNATLGEYRSLEVILGSVGIAGERTRDFLHAINRSVSQGQLGLGEYTRAFEILGVTAEEFGSFGAQERVFALLDAIRELSQEDAAFVVSTIGQRAGREILALRNAEVDTLRQRADSIERLVDSQEQLRLSASNANAEYKLAFGELKSLIEGELIPSSGVMVDLLTSGLEKAYQIVEAWANIGPSRIESSTRLLEDYVDQLDRGVHFNREFERAFHTLADRLQDFRAAGGELTDYQLTTLERANEHFERNVPRIVVESVRKIRRGLADATQNIQIPVDFKLPPTAETQAKLDAEAAKVELAAALKFSRELSDPSGRYSKDDGSVRKRYEEEQRLADELGRTILREQQESFRAREDHLRRVDRIEQKHLRAIGQWFADSAAATAAARQEQELAEAQLQSGRLAATHLWGSTISTVLNNAVSGTREWGDVILDILGNVLQQALNSPTGFGGLFTGLFGGGRAAGGPVTGGTTYLVGEQGPELFTPDVSGSIVPNPGGVTVNSTVNVAAGVSRVEFESAIDARDAELVETITRLTSTPGTPLSTAVRVASG